MTGPSEALLPCPFCGGQPGTEFNQTAGYRVATIVCACGARGKPFVAPSSDDRNLAEAIAAWNTRATAPLIEEIEAAREEVQWAMETLQEINPSNYGHDDVCDLNAASVEVYLGLQRFLPRLTAALAAHRGGGEGCVSLTRS